MYPIQLLYWQWGSGAGIEFYRRMTWQSLVTSLDLDQFVSCVSGPDIPWTQAVNCAH